MSQGLAASTGRKCCLLSRLSRLPRVGPQPALWSHRARVCPLLPVRETLPTRGGHAPCEARSENPAQALSTLSLAESLLGSCPARGGSSAVAVLAASSRAGRRAFPASFLPAKVPAAKAQRSKGKLGRKLALQSTRRGVPGTLPQPLRLPAKADEDSLGQVAPPVPMT